MMVEFYKYQGTGNDFILVDNRNGLFRSREAWIKKACDRRFGIGADGLILLQEIPGYDFEMVYFNSDGRPSSMCGNGGRCIVSFAHSLGVIKKIARFHAPDGEHLASIEGKTVSLKMKDVEDVEKGNGFFFLDTGSPHFVKSITGINNYDVALEGKKIRYNERFEECGTNVNFIEPLEKGIFVRTYERGVEDETYSCGTGVTASAIVASLLGYSEPNKCCVKTLGGDLEVKFRRAENNRFADIWLTGPAEMVFKGEISE